MLARILSYASGALFVYFAVWFMLTLNWWLFGVSLLFQVGIFLPEMVVNYRKMKRRKERG